METGRNVQLNAYREHLLSTLRERKDSRDREESGPLHVFVDEDRIGTLEQEGAGATLVFTHHERPPRMVEIRTESGLLVGGLCAPEVGSKSIRFCAGRSRVELTVQNGREGGTITAVCCVTHPVRHRIARAWKSLTMGRTRIGERVFTGLGNLAPAPARTQRAELWSRAGVLAQAVLAVAVLFLVGERITDDVSGPRRATTEEVLARQEQMLAKLMQTQEEVKRTLQAQLSDAAVKRAELHDQIQHLTMARESLSKEVAQLQTRAVVTEIKLANQASSFKFWVSFQEGTPRKRIDQWVKEIHGRKGPTHAGWHSVEVDLPQSQTQDGLLASLKNVKIVKSIATKLDTQPTP